MATHGKPTCIFIRGEMVKITFIQPDGTAQTVTAEEGLTVMEAAKMADVPGI